MLADQIIFALFGVMVVYTILLFGFIVYLVPRVHKSRLATYQAGLTQAKTAYERQLLTSRLEIKEDILQKVSLELHDNIGQKIYLSKLYLGVMDGNNPAFAGQVAALDRILNEASDDLHDLLKLLDLNLSKNGDLANAIKNQLRQLENTSLFTISFIEEGPLEGISPEQEILLYRIFQESINNIIRHARADHIEIRLQGDRQTFRLAIEDNGRGFSCSPTGGLDGLVGVGNGLHNIRKRAEWMNADLVIKSGPGTGTLIDVSVTLI